MGLTCQSAAQYEQQQLRTITLKQFLTGPKSSNMDRDRRFHEEMNYGKLDYLRLKNSKIKYHERFAAYDARIASASCPSRGALGRIDETGTFLLVILHRVFCILVPGRNLKCVLNFNHQ